MLVIALLTTRYINGRRLITFSQTFGLTREVWSKNHSLTRDLGTNGLKVTSKPPPMPVQAGRLQGQDRSAVPYPSSSDLFILR
ncbi:hypothetical protein J6590_014633 [Homalodisca vitripennis]|nr:hypothetical protein J6590_014633 [Homalodisca vitripennis]